MTILNIIEAVKGGTNNTSNKVNLINENLKEIFKNFFGKLDITISSEEDLNEYLNLFRIAIAHHSDYYIDFSSDELDVISFKKDSRVSEKNINFNINIEQLSELANSLLGIFKDSPTVQEHFSGGIRLNSLIEKFLINEDTFQDSKRIEDLDLSYGFYISSLFEMIKYMKNSIKKIYKSSIVNRDELLKMLHGLKGDILENSPISISNILICDKTIESMILFYYNAYPNDVIEIFNGISFNNKSIQQLLDEYSMKIGEESKEKTDFEILVENTDNNPQIQNLKEKIIEHYFLNLPKINRLYFSDGSIEVMPSMSLLLDGFESESRENDEIIYWTNEDLTGEDNSLNIYRFMDKIRNAIMHNKVDVQHIEKSDKIAEPVYSFQDNTNSNNTNFIVTHITSLQLKTLLSESARILQEVGIILGREKAKSEGDSER